MTNNLSFIRKIAKPAEPVNGNLKIPTHSGDGSKRTPQGNMEKKQMGMIANYQSTTDIELEKLCVLMMWKKHKMMRT